MQPFPPLTEYGRKLLTAVLAAHANSCARQNISSQTVINTAAGSGDYTKAIAGAILTIGGLHAPLRETMALLNQPPSDIAASVRLCLANGWKVPGWGNSFEKGAIDQVWLEVDALIQTSDRWYHAVNEVTEILHDSGKLIYPNPSAYTAICALEIGLPSALAPYLFIAGRLGAWTSLVGKVVSTNTAP